MIPITIGIRVGKALYARWLANMGDSLRSQLTLPKFSVQADLDPVKRELKDFREQIPFALSKGLNALALEAQRDIRRNMSDQFTLRRPDFLHREGAKLTKFATKTSPTAVLEVSQKAAFLTKHEEGGIKAPIDGRSIAIPTDAVRRTKTDVIMRSQRPRALLASKSSTLGRVWIDRTRGVIRKSMGRGKHAVVRTLYLLRPRVRIAPRLKFVETALATTARSWQKHASEAAEYALRTMRKK